MVWKKFNRAHKKGGMIKHQVTKFPRQANKNMILTESNKQKK